MDDSPSSLLAELEGVDGFHQLQAPAANLRGAFDRLAAAMQKQQSVGQVVDPGTAMQPVRPGSPDTASSVHSSELGGMGVTPDVRKSMDVTLEELLNGATRRLAYFRNVVCTACSGAGGSTSSRRRVLAPWASRSKHLACPACRGTSLHTDLFDGDIVIEPGMTGGSCVAWLQGAAGCVTPGAAPGDVLLHLSELPHPVFTRRAGRAGDLEVVKLMSQLEAAGGAVFRVPLLGGGMSREMSSQEAGQHGLDAVIHLEGLGMPVFGGQPHERGDLYVRIRTDCPLPRAAQLREGLPELERAARQAAQQARHATRLADRAVKHALAVEAAATPTPSLPPPQQQTQQQEEETGEEEQQGRLLLQAQARFPQLTQRLAWEAQPQQVNVLEAQLRAHNAGAQAALAVQKVAALRRLVTEAEERPAALPDPSWLARNRSYLLSAGASASALLIAHLRWGRVFRGDARVDSNTQSEGEGEGREGLGSGAGLGEAQSQSVSLAENGSGGMPGWGGERGDMIYSA